jgi:anti-sigma factor RsiW
MECPNLHRLSAFCDGELPAVEADAMRAHIEQCAQCAAALTDIRQMSQTFVELRARPLSTVGLNRAHNAADKAADAIGVNNATIRIARILTGLAASIAIIATAWLLDDNARPPAPAASVPPVAVASDWERTAITLDVAPTTMDDRLVFVDAAVTDWMLRSLNR